MDRFARVVFWSVLAVFVWLLPKMAAQKGCYWAFSDGSMLPAAECKHIAQQHVEDLLHALPLMALLTLSVILLVQSWKLSKHDRR